MISPLAFFARRQNVFFGTGSDIFDLSCVSQPRWSNKKAIR